MVLYTAMYIAIYSYILCIKKLTIQIEIIHIRFPNEGHVREKQVVSVPNLRGLCRFSYDDLPPGTTGNNSGLPV